MTLHKLSMLTLMVCAATAMQSCGGACSTRGCDDGVRLEFADAQGADISSFEGVAVIDGNEWTFGCDNLLPTNVESTGFHCLPSGNGVLLTKVPTTLELSVTTSSGLSVSNLVISTEFEPHNPNEPGCNPACSQSRHRIVLR